MFASGQNLFQFYPPSNFFDSTSFNLLENNSFFHRLADTLENLSELVQLKLNIESSVGDSTPTEVE